MVIRLWHKFVHFQIVIWWRAICTLCKIVFRPEWCSLRGCGLEVVMQYLTMVHWCIWLLYFIRKVTYLLCLEDFWGVWLLSYYVSHFSSPHLLVSNHNLFDWLHQTDDNRMLLVWWEGKDVTKIAKYCCGRDDCDVVTEMELDEMRRGFGVLHGWNPQCVDSTQR